MQPKPKGRPPVWGDFKNTNPLGFSSNQPIDIDVRDAGNRKGDKAFDFGTLSE